PCIKDGSTQSTSGLSVLSGEILFLIYMFRSFDIFSIALNPSRPPRNKQKKSKNFQKSYASKENQEESGVSLVSHNLLTSGDPLSGGDQQNLVLTSAKQSVRITQFTDPH